MAEELTTAKPQLLHLVLGGVLTELDGNEFKELWKMAIARVVPPCLPAYGPWQASAQTSLANAHMRHRSVHPPRLLEPQATRRPGRWMSIRSFRRNLCASRRGKGPCARPHRH